MGMGMGGIQPLVAQLRDQGAFGNPYVSPALGGGEKIPQAGTAMAPSYKDMPANYQEAKDAFHAQGGGMTAGQAMTRDQFGNMWSSTAANEFDSFYNKNYGGTGGQQPIQMLHNASTTPQQQIGAVNATYTPAGSGAGLSSILSGNSGVSSSSGSLNSMPSMGSSAGAGGSGGPFPLEGKYGIIKMANGGLAGAAQNMANKGRDGDSMLVHMSPGEVKGLQALAMAHGGSLSINPDTGLVEASFLKRILPMIAGAGLAMIPGVGPLAAAGMVGGFETVRTGDIGKGLMAGLGAYGGAGLAGGISSAGASSIADAGGSAAVDQLGSQATNLSADQLSNLSAEQLQGLKSVSDSGMYNTADVLKTANAANANTGAQNLLGAQNFPNLNASQLQGYSDALNSGAYSPQDIMRSAGAQNATAGASGMQTAGAGLKAGPSAIYDAMPTGTMMGLGATAANMLTPEAPSMPGMPEEDERYKGSPYRYNLAPGFQGATPARPNPYYRPTGLGYAEGGDVMEAAGGAYIDEPMGDVAGMAAGGIAGYAAGGLKMKTMSLGEGMYRDTDTDTASLNAFEAAKKRMAKVNKAANMPKNYAAKMPEVRGLGELAMAQGGLGGYSDGGRMLKGPGDGMSDDIPAVIGRKQPARLADGEFVVPADVVSHLGNGSTDAGAKKLYSMMDKVRRARTGKKKQAPAVKASKYMPA